MQASLVRYRFLLVLFLAADVVRSIDIDSSILTKAAEYTKRDDDLHQKAKAGDISTMYRVGNHMLRHGEAETGLQILHALADVSPAGHVPSKIALSRHYYAQENHQLAIRYFEDAGQNGPHQASLYNAARVHAELRQWVPAIAFCNACATYEEGEDPALSKTYRDAFALIVSTVSRHELSIKETADLFLYGNLHSFPPEEVESDWKEEIFAIQYFNDTFVASAGQEQDQVSLEKAVFHLRRIWETHSVLLSPLQAYLLLDYMSDMLGPLAGLEDAYLAAAGGYAEALALTPLCFEFAAQQEKDPACFNGAAASVVSYYRRVADAEGSKRVLSVARQHPHASTQWERVEQTPRVFHPGLEAKAW